MEDWMATRLRLPPLLDIVLVDDPGEMDWFDREAAIVREVLAEGGWLHRLLRSRIYRTLTVGPVPLPVFAGRGDSERALQQAKLDFRLSHLSTAPRLDAPAMAALARHVAGIPSDEPVGVAAQQVVGRMFVPEYAASRESYAAAKLLASWSTADPVRALWWLWSGRVAKSRQLLWGMAENDPQCIHATTIAVHGIVEALDRMQALMGDGRRRDVLDAARAVSASLVAPRALLRSCSRPMCVPFMKEPLGPGTLVVFRLRGMHARAAGDDGLAFAAGRWNQCPAHAIVPRLLGEVWTAAYREWAEQRYAQYRPAPLVRLAARGFAALNRIVPWHRLPIVLGLANLALVRVVLRERNLHGPAPSRTAAGKCPVATPPASSTPGAAECPVTGTSRVRSARTADGTHNDLADPRMGGAGTCFARNRPLAFARPEPEPAMLQPNPRLVSRRLMTRHEFIPARTLNVLAAAWIQFQVHDWFNHQTNPTEPPFEVEIERGDSWPEGERPMKIERSARHEGAAGSVATPSFANTETHWWDASQLYGSSAQAQARVRAWHHGKLLVGPDGRLPFDPDTGLEVTGFNNNWWVGLSLLHGLFALEHNAICDLLRREYPAWGDEQLFSTARLVNAALIAKIHSLEWTPGILAHPTVRIGMGGNWWGLVGERLRRLLGRPGEWDVLWGIPGSLTDHHSAPYAMTEEFVAIYRMHPLLPDDFALFSARDGSSLGEPLALAGVAGLNTNRLRAQTAPEDLLYSLGIANPGAITLHNYPKGLQRLDRRLLHAKDNSLPIDLAAVDVLRDRERGVPRYNAFRAMLHLPPVRTFEELSPRWAAELRDVYQHVDRIDLMVGLFAETPPRGFGFSDTAFRLFVLMASRRLKSDRFFTTDYTPAVYTQTGLDWIANTEMKDVLLRHYPALAPAVQRVANVFAPWDRVAGVA